MHLIHIQDWIAENDNDDGSQWETTQNVYLVNRVNTRNIAQPCRKLLVHVRVVLANVMKQTQMRYFLAHKKARQVKNGFHGCDTCSATVSSKQLVGNSLMAEARNEFLRMSQTRRIFSNMHILLIGRRLQAVLM